MVALPRREADVVIVGAGAAGCAVAAKLAAGGKSVIVLEAGPPWTLADLTSNQIWARRLKWGGAPVEFRGNHRGFGHNANTGWGIGGAALHHYATWPRMVDDAFQVRSKHGRGIDWPFPGSELRRWYDQVQDEVGISGDVSQELWRPDGAPYPMPGQKLFEQAKLLARGFAKLGLPVAPLPAAVTTTEYRGRPACLYDGWCDAGCPIGSLANPLVTYHPQAEQAGAQFFANAQVTRILPAKKDRAAGIEWADSSGERRQIEAQHVVLAGSAIQNPRLMLASASLEWPRGPGNDIDQVGRNFSLDMVALVYGMFDRPTENHMGVSAGQLMNRANYGEREGAPFGAWQWQIAPSMKPNDIFGIATTRADLFGLALHDFIRRGSKHLANQVAMIEQLPDPENRVALSEQKDRFGMPLARVEHRFTAEQMALWGYVIDEGKRVMVAAGALDSWNAPFNAGHLIGGTLMGANPDLSVADASTRVHGIENLWLTGSGLFPTSGGTSPTFTLTALALRTADSILAS